MRSALPAAARVAFSELGCDLRQVWKAWSAAPLLPVFACVLALAQAALVEIDLTPAPVTSIAGWIASLALGVFWLGWLGTQRVWYLRAFDRESFGLRLLWVLSWKYAARFLRLGLLVAWRFIVVWVLLVALFVVARRSGGTSLPAWYYLGAFAGGVPISAFLTFTAPALTYATRGPAEALRIGFAMTRTYWPDVALYVLLPPAAVLLASRASAQQLGGHGLLLASAVSALVNLMLAGASASFFLRHHEVVPAALPVEARQPGPPESES